LSGLDTNRIEERNRLPLLYLARRFVNADPFDFSMFLDDARHIASRLRYEGLAVVFVYDPIQMLITSVKYIPTVFVSRDRCAGLFYRWKLFRLDDLYVQIGSRICVESFNEYLALASSCREPYMGSVLEAEAELKRLGAEELEGCDAISSASLECDEVRPIEEVYLDTVEECRDIRIVIGSEAPPSEECSLWIPRETYPYLYAVNRLMRASSLSRGLRRRFILELVDSIARREQLSCTAPRSLWVEVLRRYGSVVRIREVGCDECTSERSMSRDLPPTEP